MPLVSPERSSQYWEPIANGPVAQADLSTVATASPPASINATTTWTSSVINADGFKFVTVAASATLAGNIIVQLYVDQAGTIKQGAAVSVPLATTGAVNNVNGSTTPFQSFTVALQNTGVSASTISGYALLLTAS